MFRESYHVARADFLDRVRDRKLLAVFAASIYLGHMATVGQIQLVFAREYRGVYTAAWIGTVMSFAASGAIAGFGFYFVKNALARDRNGGPKKLIASSSVDNVTYLLGKWLSNVAILSLITFVMSMTVVVLFFVRGTGPFDLWKLLSPFVLFTLPVAALVGAVALLFESVSFLRGSLGNVIYFFGVATLPALAPFDLLGGAFVLESMEAALSAQYPAYESAGYAFGQVRGVGELQTFRWTGFDVTGPLLLNRVQSLFVALGIIVVTVLPFDRFEPADASKSRLPSISLSVSRSRTDGDAADAGRTSTSATTGTTNRVAPEATTTATDLGSLDVTTSLRPIRLVSAELRLAVRGHSWPWYVGGAGLVLVGAGLTAMQTMPGVGPAQSPEGLGMARDVFFAIAWMWPLFVWSEMGVREYEHHTQSFVFSSGYPLAQLGATWVAGVVVTTLFVGPFVAPLAVAGELTAVSATLVGIAFVPSLALAAGVVSKTSRLFEIGYLVLWYFGPASGVSAVDYSGVTNPSSTTTAGFAVTAVALLGAAFLVRRRQIQ